MDKLLIVIGAIVAIVGVFFFLPALGALLGYFVGWVVSLFFPQTTTAFLAAIGMGSLSFSQYGAMVAFTAGFFRQISNKA